jgi:hypothetical protein
VNLNKAATAFIFLGIFLASGVYSFVRQKQSKSVIALLAIASVASLATGFMYM